jgi:hypothetical protein
MVILACLHIRFYPKPAPGAGERVYCFECGRYMDVAEAPHNYSVRCDACTYGRDVGNARITAETSAVKHANRRPGHRVVIFDGEMPDGEYFHPVLPANVDVPPF